MQKETDRVNVCKKMKCGKWCTCIRYSNARDCDFKFDDGVIVEHRQWAQFMKGTIAYPQDLSKERVGIRRKLNCGLWCECIQYRTVDDCDFRFDDGTVIQHYSWDKFQKGAIAHPHGKRKERIGVRKQMNCGSWCTCILYNNSMDCNFRFDDGTIVEHKRWDKFEQGNISHPLGKGAQRIGTRKQMNCGLWCECIQYRTADDCDFRFDDGAIVTHRSWHAFEHGSIAHLTDFVEERRGMRKQMNCGLWCTCIRYGTTYDCDFLFDDGIVVAHRDWAQFDRHTIAHPNLSAKRLSIFYKFQCVYANLIIGDNVYYKCIDLETGEKQILAPYEILKLRGVKLCNKQNNHQT